LFEGQDAVATARARLLPVLERIAAIEAELAPYEDIKKQLAEARARYRELTAAFVDVLKARCDELREDEKRALVLELFAQDV
jgi:type I restriction enzyme M protein